MRTKQTMEEAAAGFLAHKRIAVTGVSRKAGAHGSNAVYQRLRQRGHEVFAGQKIFRTIFTMTGRVPKDV